MMNELKCERVLASKTAIEQTCFVSMPGLREMWGQLTTADQAGVVKDLLGEPKFREWWAYYQLYLQAARGAVTYVPEKGSPRNAWPM
jgi:hypothetical protein